MWDPEPRSFDLAQWHRWPRPMAWWQYGILFSLGCSALCIGLLVFGR